MEYKLNNHNVEFFQFETVLDVIAHRHDDFSCEYVRTIPLIDSDIKIHKFIAIHKKTGKIFLLDILGNGTYDLLTYEETTRDNI